MNKKSRRDISKTLGNIHLAIWVGFAEAHPNDIINYIMPFDIQRGNKHPVHSCTFKIAAKMCVNIPS